MLVRINKGDESFDLNIDKLINTDISSLIYSFDNVEIEDDVVEVITPNPVTYKPKNMAVLNNVFSIYNVPDKKISFRYSSSENEEGSFFKEILRLASNGQGVSIINELFPKKNNILTISKNNLLSNYLRSVALNNKSYRPSVQFYGGFYFARKFSNESIFALSQNNITDAIVRKRIGSGYEPFIGNIHNTNEICWGNLNSEVSKIKRQTNIENTDFSETLSQSMNLFLGSTFNHDLDSTVTLSRSRKKLIIDYMVSTDFSKHLSEENSELLRREIIENSDYIFSRLKNDYKTKDILTLTTFFDIPYHVFH